MNEMEPPPVARDRRPALALFAGGLLSGAAVVVLALTLGGVIGPGRIDASPAASSEALLPGPLVTLPPIAAPTVTTPTALADGHALGDEDAPVTVEVWADFQCPYCALFTQYVEPQIVSTYVETGQVRLVFRDLAFLGEESRWAAVAARLAEAQDAFWPFHDYLFANQQGENKGGFSLARLREIAGRVDLDMAAFNGGMLLEPARATFAQIRAEFEADASRLGINSTPTVVVNGTVATSANWDVVRAAIEAALPGS